MFHHLDADLRIASLREVLRVLRPEASLHLMDFGGDSHHLRGLTRFTRRSRTLQDNWTTGSRHCCATQDSLNSPRPVSSPSTSAASCTTAQPARGELTSRPRRRLPRHPSRHRTPRSTTAGFAQSTKAS